MRRTLASISSLLLGIGISLMGVGLLATVLGLRAVAEGFPDTVTGLVMSAYFAGFVFGTYACPRLVRRVGPIRTYTALAALGSAGMFAHSLLVHPLFWALLRFITGACIVGLYLVLESWLNMETPNEQRGQVLASYTIVTLAALGGGQLLLLVDPAAGPTAFGLAAAFLALGLVPIAITRLPEPAPVGAPHGGLHRLLAGSPLSVAGALAAGLSTSAFWGMGAVFAQRAGLTTEGVAAFMGITILGGLLWQLPIGRLSDHLDRRVVLLVVAIMAAAAAAITTVAGGTIFYAGAFLLGSFVFSIYGLSVAYLNDRLPHEHLLDASRGILLVFGIGAAFGPALAGLLMDRWGPAWLTGFISAVLAGLAAFAAYRMQVTEAVPESEREPYVPVTRTSQAVLEMDPRAVSDEEHDQRVSHGREEEDVEETVHL